MFGRKSKFLTRVESPERGYDSFELKLGDEMRGERATLGKSLMDVQRELRIKASYIAAIENTDLSAFDSLSFVAGYVRSYARYLDMDPEIVFARFCEESGFGGIKALRPMESEVSRRTALGSDLAVPGKVAIKKRKKGAEPTDPLLGSSNPFAGRRKPAFAGVEPGALGSLVVLALLLGGIGYGGWTVVQEIQRVTVAPVDEAPVLQAELDPLSAAMPGLSAPDGSEVDAPSQEDSLARLYRPQALETPELTPRDAPISTIRPGTEGVLAYLQQPDLTPPPLPAAAEVQPTEIAGTVDAAVADALDVAGVEGADAPASPRVLEEEPDAVVIVAVRDAWIRLRSAEGDTLLEKVLSPGETYEVPAGDAPHILRTGNSGAVYFSVAGQTYGPIAPGQEVLNAEVSAELVTEEYALADLSEDQDLARVVAELQVEPVLPGTETPEE
ncbi:MAG: helix-turn-helix domain-containing protein [Pseudomonadota bacterium]